MTEEQNREDGQVEESPDYIPAEAEADWNADELGSMADYATDDDAVELEEGDD